MTDQTIADILKKLIDDLNAVVYFLTDIRHEMHARERMKDE